MERITYRITLDAYKNGIQRVLQGFETADNMARRIAINLTSGGDTFELPSSNLVAMMYVTVPGTDAISINNCEIVNDTIIYDVLPIIKEGITEMQLKLIESRPDGAKKVLAYPKFAVEVTESNMNDTGAMQTTTFTALEDAVAKAEATYSSRLVRIEIDEACVFRAYYADGTIYENDYLHEALYNGNALLSESWAKGGTGVRPDEDTNNSMYFSNVSRSASADASMITEDARGLLEEAMLHSTFTAFKVDFFNGELEYVTGNYTFDINELSGDLEVVGSADVEFEGIVEESVNDFMEAKSKEINDALDGFENDLKEIDANLESLNAHVNESLEEIENNLKDLKDKEVDVEIFATTTSKDLENSKAGGLKVLNVYGKSEQETTTGKNLLRNGATSKSERGITYTVNSDGTVLLSGTPDTGWNIYLDFPLSDELDVGEYIFTCTPQGGTETTYYAVVKNKAGVNIGKDTGSGVKFSLTEKGGVLVTLAAREGSTYNNVLFKPMIRLASIADDTYEPYGISPSPEKPSPIVSAGQNLADGVATDTCIEYKVIGKNLCPQNFERCDYQNDNGDKKSSEGYHAGTPEKLLIPIGKTLTLSHNHTFTGSSSIVKLMQFDKDGSFISRHSASASSNNITFVPDENCVYMTIVVYDSNGVNLDGLEVQLEVGTEVTTYEPYTEQTFTLNKVLRGIPVTDSSLATYTDENGQMWCADYGDVERKVWVQRVGVKKLPSDGWSRYTNWTNPNSFVLKNLLSDAIRVDGYGVKANLMSNRFTTDIPSKIVAIDSTDCIGQGEGYNIYISVDGITTTSQIKTYLTNNETIIQYILATPIETPMTDDEVIALHSLKTYNGVTNITTENVPEATLEVEYGTSEVGAMVLENSNLHVVNELLKEKVENAIDEINNALPFRIEIDDEAGTINFIDR